METTKRPRGRPVGSSSVRQKNMQKLLVFVKEYHAEHSIAPTLTEIAVALGFSAKSVGNVQPMVKQLVSEGFLVQAGENQGRSIALAKPQPRKYYYKVKGE